MKIAICISTYNRLGVLEKALAFHKQFKPKDAMLIVVDDSSDHDVYLKDVMKVVRGTDRYTWQTNHVGIPATKNMCLQLAYEAGAEHIFLFDDDCWPIAKDWWKPYVKHPEPHLMYQFKQPGKAKTDMRELYRDAATVAYTHTRGAMIYLARPVLDIVGGFDTEYGLGGYEHPDLTTRIHNAGLTSFRAMDVPNSDLLLYCLDQDGSIVSSLPKGHKGNYKLYQKNKSSKEYKEFRT